MSEQKISLSDSLVSNKRQPHLSGATDIVLRQARKLHRAALTGSLCDAMPALRRVHTAGVLPGLNLRALYESRQDLKRKHFLRALAVEAGYADWESFRAALNSLPEDTVQQFRVMDDQLMFLSLWFSTEEQALAHVREHGGASIRVGKQAVVISPDSIDPTKAIRHAKSNAEARHVV